MLAEYRDGTKFRAASETGNATSLLDVLNAGCEATGFKPLLIRGWGYNQEEQKFLTGGTLGGKLKQFSMKPHMATDTEGQEIEIKLVAHEDKKTKSTYYVLRKSDQSTDLQGEV